MAGVATKNQVGKKSLIDNPLIWVFQIEPKKWFIFLHRIWIIVFVMDKNRVNASLVEQCENRMHWTVRIQMQENYMKKDNNSKQN